MLGHRVICLVAACLAALSCGPSKPEEPKLHVGPTATLVGELLLAPGARLPELASVDLARRTLRVADALELPEECAQAHRDAQQPVTLTPEGRLRGVVVAASDFTRVSERKPKKHKVHIEHCRLQPSIIAAQGGDTLELENHDSFPFEPLVGPAFEGHPLPRGKTIEVPLVASGLDTVQCSLRAPCGRTDLLVFHHPVHAVSDDTGQFRIENFPAGELVRVTAWHPLFEPVETFVWLEPGQQTTTKLQLTPRPRFLAAQP
jgi:hypothetical protein